MYIIYHIMLLHMHIMYSTCIYTLDFIATVFEITPSFLHIFRCRFDINCFAIGLMCFTEVSLIYSFLMSQCDCDSLLFMVLEKSLHADQFNSCALQLCVIAG